MTVCTNKNQKLPRFYLITNPGILNYFCNFSLCLKISKNLCLMFHVSCHENQKQSHVSVSKYFKRGVLRSFANFPGNWWYWSLFLIRLKGSNFFKRDSSTGVFLWNLQNFKKSLIYRTPPLAASGKLRIDFWIRSLRCWYKRGAVVSLLKIRFQARRKHSI